VSVDVIFNPLRAVDSLTSILRSVHAVSVTQSIGLAILYLFGLLELYRLWFEGRAFDFGVLAAKIAVVHYLITSPAINDAGTVLLAWTYHAGFQVAWSAFSSVGDQIRQVGGVIAGGHGPGTFWTILFGQLNYFLLIVAALISAAVYLFVIAFIFGVYIFAVVTSGVVYALAIVMAPILLPMALWPPTRGFAANWVSTVLHAMFLPLVGGVLVYSAVNMGLLAPLSAWGNCAANSSSGTQILTCLSAGIGNVLIAIMAGIASMLLMLSLDGLTKNFFPAAEVTGAALYMAKQLSQAGAGAGLKMIRGGGPPPGPPSR
jgi:type IV secretory pathway VirB6-like protein